MNSRSPLRTLDEPWTEVYDSQSVGMSLPRRFWAVPGSLWQSRALAWRLFQRNLTANYRQSFLGWLWVLLPPLAAAGVWVFLNASGTLQLSSLGLVGYAAFVFSGMMLWQAFIDGLTSPMNTLLANRTTLSKLQFPREVFVSLSLLETAFDFLARWVVAGVFLWLAGLIDWLGFALLALVWGPALIVLGTGLGLILAPFGLLYKDVGRTIALISPLWMLLTPVIYPLPANSAGWVMACVNPPAAAIEVARQGVVRSPETEGKDGRFDQTSDPAVDAMPNRPASQSLADTDLSLDPEPPRGARADAAGTVPGQATLDDVTAAEIERPEEPSWSVLLPAVAWLSAGLLLFLLGAVWLDLSGPIVIERLAN